MIEDFKKKRGLGVTNKDYIKQLNNEDLAKLLVKEVNDNKKSFNIAVFSSPNGEIYDDQDEAIEKTKVWLEQEYYNDFEEWC